MLSFLFACFLVPETKSLSLKQVDKMLAETTPRKSAKCVLYETWATTGGIVEKHSESVERSEKIV